MKPSRDGIPILNVLPLHWQANYFLLTIFYHNTLQFSTFATMKTTSICLWSSPRNISTALMYAFAQRQDMTVVDEPLYAHYLLQSDKEHPGRKEILNSQEKVGEQVVRKVILGDYPTPYVLHKQMTHHLINLDLDFLNQTKNVLLIRSPYEITRSYSKVVNELTKEDLGIPQQERLYNHLRKTGNIASVVDAKTLLLNPKDILEKLCTSLDIPFDKSMLSWKPGARQEDGVWAKYWYANVHKSKGFKPYSYKEEQLPDHLMKVVDECHPHYEFLLEQAIK